MYLEWPRYRMFDYERELAAREIRSLTGSNPIAADDGLTVSSHDVGSVSQRLTYAGKLEYDNDDIIPDQALVETRHLRSRSTQHSRQATRYLVHGLHEYKGKFNPQLARSLMNIVDPEATSLLDPFSGSGTTLVEGLRLGKNVTGIDRSPIAAWISDVKLAALTTQRPGLLQMEFETLRQQALDSMKMAQNTGRGPREIPVEEATHQYLERWFPPRVLAGLLAAVKSCRDQHGTASDLILIAVSSIARSVSWQLPEDLRIRRRPADWIPPDVSVLFDEACARIDAALSEVTMHPPVAQGLNWEVRQGSCDDARVIEPSWAAGRRLIVTSPPYATALPYIDTDRLSIALLGLASSADLGPLERSLIGSREWNRAEAARWSDRWENDTDAVPKDLRSLLDEIASRNTKANAGFRRRDVPPLLYRYFASMGSAIERWAEYMRSGERAVLVVGRNRTGPRGEQVTIDTPWFLGAVASDRGFRVVESIELETWPRFGLHASNGVDTEDAVVLERR